VRNGTERAIIEEHSEMGARIVEAIPFLEDLVTVIQSHHERWDGRGYPDGLAGDEIPLGARILAIADAFDAMTSDRPYRQAKTIDFAVTELIRHRGEQFDPMLVDALTRFIGTGGARPAAAALATR
jgi:HD-GYP domain-containing protein (c-di-GMP phosphodiesterase class II)